MSCSSFQGWHNKTNPFGRKASRSQTIRGNTRWNNKQHVSWLGYLQDPESGKNRMMPFTDTQFHSTRTEPCQGVKDTNQPTLLKSTNHYFTYPAKPHARLQSSIKLHNTYWHITGVLTVFFTVATVTSTFQLQLLSICEADIEASNREMPACRHWKSRCQSLLICYGEKTCVTDTWALLRLLKMMFFSHEE